MYLPVTLTTIDDTHSLYITDSDIHRWSISNTTPLQGKCIELPSSCQFAPLRSITMRLPDCTLDIENNVCITNTPSMLDRRYEK